MTNQIPPLPSAAEQGEIVRVFEQIKQCYLNKVRLYVSMNIPAEIIHEILTELNTIFKRAKISVSMIRVAAPLAVYLTEFDEYKEPSTFTELFAMGQYHSVNHSKL